MTKMPSTDEILTKDAHLIQSFANLDALKQADARTAIVGADGVHVIDSEGNRLLDGIGGLWCVNVGHKRREIIDAITEQLETLDYYSTFYNFTHPKAAALAAKVASLAPGNLNRVHFGNSGSVANDSAVRMLHHYFNRLGKPKKKKVLSRHGAYHGSTHLAMAMTTPAYSDGWDTAADGLVHHLMEPCHYHRTDPEMTEAEFLDVLIEDARKAIHDIGPENIACFIAEPIQGAGGVLVAPDGYNKAMRELTAENEIKYIADEVVTAFGRLGAMFASQDVFGMTPDIITTAKGLTSGYQPLSATIIDDEIYEVISEPGAMFLHGMTYSGHPAAAAAALANIEIMEREDIPGRVKTTGKQFETGLKGLIDLDIVGDVRGSHFMIGLEFVRDKATRTPFEADANVGMAVAQHCQKRGLVARALGNSLILSPTLVMTPEQIDVVVGTVGESIRATMADLGR
ncbi:adenosylmethionine-8-amino-7-oxononanoate aminotransferase [Aliiruegeria haliotis]|uniref:Adenosylmethionine-8-amino-7-oxononanoate aminotransferase n=1 Tax=Aliiruegeria haliotis TaxID=1280846 RepID=A0A2T0RWF8_9RHOB|nr:aminotransferase class III-fold pyridoxal phosphate-dependent enzyme [Aliiruegeria haliotis]PRY25525.1 adenosylmethionine-8-amino-7-oxononanoate aminotransferase [Aliiruegeria haliotis]